MDWLNKVINIFNELQNTSSRNEKEAIIAANKDNELFKKCLVFLLDGNVVTGISSKKWNKIRVSSCDYAIDESFEWLLDYVQENNTGRDEDIKICKKWLIGRSDEIGAFTEGMICKSLKVGIDAKTVNKCIPGLINVFSCQLGTPIEKAPLKGDEWISISQKMNGTRTCWVGNKFMTRQGKEYKGLDHIKNDLLSMNYSDWFIDGELVYKNDGSLTDSEAFQLGTGIAMSKDKDKTCLQFVVFDMFPLCEFWSGKSKEKYINRKIHLHELEEAIRVLKIKNVRVVPFIYEGYDHSMILKCLDKAEELGWEGCMVNTNEIYQAKRVKTLLKVKKFFSCDIRCTGIEEGSGRNKGLLGALVCDYKGYQLKVGSGFSDEQRKDIWANPDSIIGKIVTVKYKEETKNKDGGISVQFPVYICTRFDKDEPSYN